MPDTPPTPAVAFLEGAPNDDGRTVETLLAASDAWLEYHHDWVQWAFPSRERSAFNPFAPVWTAAEARALAPQAVANLRRLLRRFELFLQRTGDWRASSDHNHARISRVLLCLRDARLYDEARAFYRFVTAAPEPGRRSRRFWLAARVASAVALRPARPGDLAPCAAVLGSNTAASDACGEAHAQLARALDAPAESGLRYLVGELDDAVVACGGLALAPGARVATLRWTGVARGLHGHGVGTRVVLACLAGLLDEARCERVEIAPGEGAPGFYARFGFTARAPGRDGAEPAVMALELDARRREALAAMIAAHEPEPR